MGSRGLLQWGMTEVSDFVVAIHLAPDDVGKTRCFCLQAADSPRRVNNFSRSRGRRGPKQTTLRPNLCRASYAGSHPRQMRLVSAGAVAASSGRGIGSEAGASAARAVAVAVAVAGRHHRIGIDHQRGGAGDGDVGRFHDASPFVGVVDRESPPAKTVHSKLSFTKHHLFGRAQSIFSLDFSPETILGALSKIRCLLYLLKEL